MDITILSLYYGRSGQIALEQAIKALTSIACAFSHRFYFISFSMEEVSNSSIEELIKHSGKNLDQIDAVLISPDYIVSERDPLSALKIDSDIKNLIKTFDITSLILPWQPSSAYKSISPIKLNGNESSIDLLLIYPLTKQLLSSPDPLDQKDSSSIYKSHFNINKALNLAYSLNKGRLNPLNIIYDEGLFDDSNLTLDYITTLMAEHSNMFLRPLSLKEVTYRIINNPTSLSTLVTSASLGDIIGHLLSSLIGNPFFNFRLLVGDKAPNIYMPFYLKPPPSKVQIPFNPIGILNACSFMLEHSLNLHQEAGCLKVAIDNVLISKWAEQNLTLDENPYSFLEQIGELIIEQIDTVGAILSEGSKYSNSF